MSECKFNVRSLVIVLLVLGTVVGGAGAAPRMDRVEGLWRDNFTDLVGVASNQQGALFPPAGYSIASDLQVWSQPQSSVGVSDKFSSSNLISAGAVFADVGTSAEYLTLWSRIHDPETIAQKCVPGSKGETCPLEQSVIPQIQNGYVSKWDAISNVYGNLGYLGGAPVAGWDVQWNFDPFMPFNSTISCWTPLITGGTRTTSIGEFPDEPLMYGAREAGLVPGLGYNISFIVSASISSLHQDHHEPYLLFQIVEAASKTAYLSTTLYEDEFVGYTKELTFKKMTPLTLHLDPAPAVPGAEWDFEVWALARFEGPITERHLHCTYMGPVWVTADRGYYTSPVFDTLSDNTKWVDIAWSMDQTSSYLVSGSTATQYYTDSPRSVILQGSPLTPIKVGYRVGASPVGLVETNTVRHGGEAAPGVIGMDMVALSSQAITDAAGNPVTGRYFQWSATLYSRSTAAELDSDLAPRNTIGHPSHIYFGGFLPKLRSISVRYYSCAARGISSRIAPTSVKGWLAVAYETDPSPLSPAGTDGRITIDVLGSDGSVLLANVASGASLAGIDPFANPALMLRATIESDGTCSKRPVLKGWQVTWDPVCDVIILGCNGIRPDLGELCRMQVCVTRPGNVRVEVHDAAGQSVKLLMDQIAPAEAQAIFWDGRNDGGEIVAAGVYFVVARTAGGKQVKRLAVIR